MLVMMCLSVAAMRSKQLCMISSAMYDRRTSNRLYFITGVSTRIIRSTGPIIPPCLLDCWYCNPMGGIIQALVV